MNAFRNCYALVDETIDKPIADGKPNGNDAPHAPAFSEEALALAFADRHAGELRYVAAWGKWLAWNGCKWNYDDTLDVFSRARALCRGAARECNKDGTAKQIASAATVAAVERLARSDRRHAATVDQWDADQYRFNTKEV